MKVSLELECSRNTENNWRRFKQHLTFGYRHRTTEWGNYCSLKKLQSSNSKWLSAPSSCKTLKYVSVGKLGSRKKKPIKKTKPNQQTPMFFLSHKSFWKTVQGYAVANTPYSTSFTKTVACTETLKCSSPVNSGLCVTNQVTAICCILIYENPQQWDPGKDSKSNIRFCDIWFWRHSLS